MPVGKKSVNPGVHKRKPQSGYSGVLFNKLGKRRKSSLEIHYSKQSEKFLKKLNADTRDRIRNAIHNLPSGDIKKLQGRSGYRLRVGNYRVIFDKNGYVLYIERIDNRGQVYKEV